MLAGPFAVRGLIVFLFTGAACCINCRYRSWKTCRFGICMPVESLNFDLGYGIESHGKFLKTTVLKITVFIKYCIIFYNWVRLQYLLNLCTYRKLKL